MKNLKVMAIFAALLPLLIVSCSKDNSPIQEPTTAEKLHIDGDYLSDVFENSDFGVISYTDWEAEQLIYKEAIGKASSLEEILQSDFVVLAAGPIRKSMTKRLVAMSTINDNNGIATFDDLVEAGILNEDAAVYVSEFQTSLEDFDGNDEQDVLAYIDSQFEVGLLSDDFDDSVASKLIQYAYNFKYEIKNYFNEDSNRFENCEWIQTVNSVGDATLSWLNYFSVGAINETILNVHPEDELTYIEPICVTVSYTYDSEECAEAMINNAWRAIYDWSCEN